MSPTPLLPDHGAREAEGRERRRDVPRSRLSRLGDGRRDPIGIIQAQNATRVPDLVPLRVERMAASPFAFYRGTAAIMAADLAAGPSTGILVPSCGDAHVANFGFYASPQRTLVFDLNDFDEGAWAPWEWDVKRLVTSIVISGQAVNRNQRVVEEAALSAVRTYARQLAAVAATSPTDRYYLHFDPKAVFGELDAETRSTMRKAMREAKHRTGERAARKLTERGEDGRLRFVEAPPTMTHVDEVVEENILEAIRRYTESVHVDIRLLMRHYVMTDIVRRVVGVGSVGTQCALVLLQDGDGNALLLQAKEAGPSVLIEHGGIEQPAEVSSYIEQHGEGGRVVALQRILQALSDPMLGHLRAVRGIDFYVRQFRDMKGGVDTELLDDVPFRHYADACAAVLARAHAQAVVAPAVVGYIGNGRVVGEAILEWAYAYAELSRRDYELFVDTAI